MEQLSNVNTGKLKRAETSGKESGKISARRGDRKRTKTVITTKKSVIQSDPWAKK